MSWKDVLNYEFENDPEGIIKSAVTTLLKSENIRADQLPDSLLKNLFYKTNMRDVLLDQEFMCHLFDTLYNTYRVLKGLPEKELSEKEFKQILLSWHLLLWIEILRREKGLTVSSYEIFDFDNLPDLSLDLKLDKTTLQTLMN